MIRHNFCRSDGRLVKLFLFLIIICNSNLFHLQYYTCLFAAGPKVFSLEIRYIIYIYIYILLTKTTATQNEVALSYHGARGLYFQAVVSAAIILGK